LFAICESYRDPAEKYFFPLIQGFSEKKSNMKIVGFFKLYTFALRLEFKNSKFATLQKEFRIKVKLIYPSLYHTKL
jgi:hypothetical protein